MRKILDSLKEKEAERAYCLAVLDLWQKVIDSQLNVDNVVAFTFRPDFLHRDQRARLNQASYAAKRDVSKFWHNCVKMKDGSIWPIELTPRPYKPGEGPSSACSGISLKSSASTGSTPPSVYGLPSALTPKTQSLTQVTTHVMKDAVSGRSTPTT